MPFLPLELIINVLEQLQDTRSALCSSSLTCRAWLPIARSILFRHVRLYPIGLECQLLFDLWESKLETLSLSRVQSLCIDSRNNVAVPATPQSLDLDRLLKWRSSDGNRTLTTIMSHVRNLRLYGLRWWTLDNSAKCTMVHGFRSVTKLHLSRVLFDVFDTPNSNANDDFLSLLNSFPELEVLEVESIHLPVNNFHREHRRIPKKLHTLSLKEIGGNARVMQLLVPCPNVETLSFTSLRYRRWGSLTEEWAMAMAEIMESAGESLKDFRLTLAPGPIDPEASPATNLLSELVTTSVHPNLESVQLNTDDSSFVFSFIERLAKSYDERAGPSLRSIVIPSLASFLEGLPDSNHQFLDQLLQHPVFSKLQKIKFDVHCHSDHRNITRPLELRTHSPFIGPPADVEMQKRMAVIRSALPLCYERGVLKAEPVF